MKLLLKNGTVIDYASNFQDIADVLIENEKIIEIKKNITEKVDEVINCEGLFIMPGMIDMASRQAICNFIYSFPYTNSPLQF